MSKAEIVELLELTGWSQAELGRRLELSESAVSYWVSEARSPTGPARILMRMWLDKFREEARKQPARHHGTVSISS